MTAAQQTLIKKVKRINAGDAVVTLTAQEYAELPNFAYENDLAGVDTMQLAIIYKWYMEMLKVQHSN